MLNVYKKRYRLLDGERKTLVARIGDGSIIKRFDKTSRPKSKEDVACPHFLEFKWGYGCNYNCSWCYLQGTLRRLKSKTQPRIKDVEKIKKHLETFLEKAFYQELLNAGEIADSLMFENSDKALSNIIKECFDSPINKKDHIALIVTKSDKTENLLKNYIEHAIISYSLNAHKPAKRWEKGAPTVDDRLAALEQLQDAGYKIRVRIDPIVPVPGWNGAYEGLINKIYKKLEPERITIGSLRGLKTTLIWAKDKSWVKYLTNGERTNFGLRIKFDKRANLYEHITNKLESYGANFALCKETIGMWNHLGLDYKKIACNCIL